MENGFSKGYVPEVNVIVHVGRGENRLSKGYVLKVNIVMTIRRSTNQLPKSMSMSGELTAMVGKCMSAKLMLVSLTLGCLDGRAI